MPPASWGSAVLLLPNAAAAVLGLAAGPGFLVGAGTLVSVHGVTLGAVPALPLLAALPDTQAVPLIAFVSQAVPALAGLVAGTTIGRWFTADDGGSRPRRAERRPGRGAAGGRSAARSCGWPAARWGTATSRRSVLPPLATGIAVAAQSGIAAALAAAVTRWRAPG